MGCKNLGPTCETKNMKAYIRQDGIVFLMIGAVETIEELNEIGEELYKLSSRIDGKAKVLVDMVNAVSHDDVEYNRQAIIITQGILNKTSKIAVFGPSAIVRTSVFGMVSKTSLPNIVKFFKNEEMAIAWLKE